MSDSVENRNLKGLRVLIVEDNLFQQKLLAMILQQWEAEVHVASNGRAAVEMVASHLYDVVIMDIMMPEMDGYEAASAIRSMVGDYYADLPIFACTAIHDSARMEFSGITGFISKSPLEKDELFDKLIPFVK
jgi:CheY-like chemotaxis protein